MPGRFHKIINSSLKSLKFWLAHSKTASLASGKEKKKQNLTFSPLFPHPSPPPHPAVQLDSAMSLIQAAKNLMNAVVSTVKASYVASTRYQKNKGMEALNMPAISWKMKAPEKKPLVKREKQDDGQTNRVKRSSHKKHVNPVQALSEFKAMDSI